MPKLTSLTNGNSPQHIIIFGPPTTGKTRLSGTAAEDFDLIWFDLEGGKDTLFQLPIEWQERITYIGIRDNVETPVAHATIDKILQGGKFKICDDHGSVDCVYCTQNSIDRWTEVTIPTAFTEETKKTVVVIDSGSQLTSSINSTCNKHLGSSIKVEWAPSRKDKDSLAEYEYQKKYLERILSRIQNAPFHVIMTAHEIEAEREDGSVRIVPSIGTRAFAINCAKYFGHVIYTDKVNMKLVAYSDAGFSNKIYTGSRLDIAIEGMQARSLVPFLNGEVGAGKNNIAKTQAVMNTVQTMVQQPGIQPGQQAVKTPLNLGNIGGLKL